MAHFAHVVFTGNAGSARLGGDVLWTATSLERLDFLPTGEYVIRIICRRHGFLLAVSLQLPILTVVYILKVMVALSRNAMVVPDV